jgi:hypothetical protein
MLNAMSAHKKLWNSMPEVTSKTRGNCVNFDKVEIWRFNDLSIIILINLPPGQASHHFVMCGASASASTCRATEFMTDYPRQGQIPSNEHVNSSIFAWYSFNMNSQLDETDEIVVIKFFSSSESSLRSNFHFYVLFRFS